MIAWTWKEEFHLKDKFEEIYDLLDSKNFTKVKEKVLLQALSAIIKQTTKTKEILDLDPVAVRDNILKLKESLSRAIDFISTQFNAKSDDFLPKAHQLVPLIYLFSKCNHLSAEQSVIVKKWFWRTSFSDRYSSSTDVKMNEDIVFFNNILSNHFDEIENYKISITKDLLLKQKFLRTSPVVKSFLLLLSQFEPLDMTNGNNVDIGKALSSYNRKEYHHIFPNAFLKDKGFSYQKINSLVNFCFLPANSNKKISDKNPSDYIFSQIPNMFRQAVFNSNLMPVELDIYNNDDFELFLEKRVEIIYNKILEVIN